MRIGYRDHVASVEEISCMGCRPGNWCRYGVARCCADRGIETCAECPEYPCVRIRECFEVTSSFEPMCRQACTDEEYERMRRAFFEKEANLDEGVCHGDGGVDTPYIIFGKPPKSASMGGHRDRQQLGF